MQRSCSRLLPFFPLLLSPFLAPSSLRAQIAQPVSVVHQHFVCNTGYTKEHCEQQMRALSAVLDRYPARALGEWTWVLVRSEDWKGIKHRIGGEPDSPAFSSLAQRETFFEEALVVPVPARSAELIKHWSSSIDQLLELAVTHELGHALCHEENEYKADAYGQLLRAGKALNCR